MIQLAIVVPAFKASYLGEALSSLSSQTNKDFNVYIGDDNSPDNLEKIVNKYKSSLNITYHRFDNNIGAKNLVNQWTRCVQLSKNEEWLWLFSDDDIAEKNCVQNFYEALNKKGDRYEVFRFNTSVINQNGEHICDTPLGPEEESSEQMAYYLLQGQRGNSMPDHIYSRDVYNRTGGFVFTDYAQAADWATSILFSKGKGISIIPDAKLYWRLSGTNISSMVGTNRNKKIEGHLQFIKWTLKHFEYLKSEPTSVTYDMIVDALHFNLKSVIISHYKGYNLSYAPKLFVFYRKFLKTGYHQAIWELLRLKMITNPRFSSLFLKLGKLKLRRFDSN